ncbi:multidrug resistance protein, MATE family [Gammaproteobacteria bacterium]
MTRIIAWLRSSHSADFKAATHKTFHLSLPIVISCINANMGGFISMIMIARLGHAELAAGALINSVMLSVMVPLWAFFCAVGALAGHQYGAKQYAEIGKVMRQSMFLGVIIGLPTTIFLRHIGAVLIFFGQDYHLSMLTQDYYQANSWGIILSLFDACFTQFFISVGKQKMSLMVTTLSALLVMSLGYVFIFGHLGIQALGISGMGYASAATNAIMFIIILANLFFNVTYQPYRLFDFFKKDNFIYLREIIKIGWPIAVMTAGELMIFAIAIILYGWLGEIALAAQNIAIQLNIMAFMITQGIGQAVTVLISQELGAKQYGSIRNLGYAATMIGVIAALLVLIIYALTYKYLVNFYLDFSSPMANATLKLAVSLLMLAGILNIFDFPRFITVCSLRGLRDTVNPMLIFVGLGCVLSLPVSYFLAFIMHFGALGMPWGFIIGYGVGSIILLRRFHRLSDTTYLAEHFH